MSFDLDDEELKATRRLNGKDQKYIVEKLIDRCNECKLKECINCEISWTELQAIKYMINKNKELEEEKEALVETVSQLIKENSELKDIIREHTLLISPYYVAQNYIPVSLVEETIEEKKQEKNKFGNCLVEFYENELVDRDIKILQELLEKRK